jgi:hypothetical protein
MRLTFWQKLWQLIQAVVVVGVIILFIQSCIFSGGQSDCSRAYEEFGDVPPECYTDEEPEP